MSIKKKTIIALAILFILALIGILTLLGGSFLVKHSTADQIVTAENAAELVNVDCILVLGCQVRDDGTPSAMLRDRLDKAIELYQLGAAPKIIMSGDHGRKDYNEVGTMKQYAIDHGIPSEDIFMDHAGFSTYESIFRAKEIFGVQKVLVVTQRYHLYRALYIANRFDMEAYGTAAEDYHYAGQEMREIREILARCKDLLTSALKPNPEYLGETIPVFGDGNITND